MQAQERISKAIGARDRDLLSDVAAAVCLVILVAVFYGTSAVVDGWTSFNDSAFVWFIHRYSPAAYLSSSAVWQEITPSNLTPLLVLRFALDYALHGLDLWHYSLKNVVALAAAALATFTLSRQFVGPLAALIFAAAFVVNPSTVITVHESSTSHYVFGLVFAIAALILFSSAVRRESLPSSLAATGLLFLANMSKEVHVPWAILFALIVLNSRRWRHLAAAFVALFVYFAWRTWLLGSPIGGHVPLVEVSAQSVLQLLYGLAGAVTGSLAVSAAIAALIAFAAAVAASRRSLDAFSALVAATAAAVIVGPLLPLALFPGVSEPGRLTFTAGQAIAIELAFPYRHLAGVARGRHVSLMVLGVVPLTVLLANAWPLREARQQTLARIAAEGRHLLRGPADEYVWLAAAPGRFTHSTEQLRQHATPDRRGPIGLADFGETWRIESVPHRLHGYEGGPASMVLAEDAGERYAQWCHSLRQRKMSVDLEYSEWAHVVRWQLRADGLPGKFLLLSPGPFDNVALTPDGAVRIHRASLTALGIRHENADGTVSYSALLNWPRPVERLSWQGLSETMARCRNL